MSADQPKPRFEPPPWEREAFERFQRDQGAAKAREDLNTAVRAVREVPETGAMGQSEAPAPHTESGVVAPVAAAPAQEAETDPRISDAHIDSMLIQLRGEEPSARTTNMPLVNSVTAFLALTGTFIVVQSAVLFGDANASGTSSTLLAATLSFMVLMTGIGFLVAAVMLFRKYHQ